MPAPRGLLTRRPRQEITKRMADQKMCVVCDGNSCGWPLAGVGSRPPGHQARSFVSSGFCVGMSALPPSTHQAPRDEETRRETAGGYASFPHRVRWTPWACASTIFAKMNVKCGTDCPSASRQGAGRRLVRAGRRRRHGHGMIAEGASQRLDGSVVNEQALEWGADSTRRVFRSTRPYGATFSRRRH